MPRTKKYRRTVRFSIRALLCLMLISAIGFAVLLHRSTARLEMINTLRDNGAIVQVSDQPPRFLGPLKHLNWGSVFVTPSHVDLYVRIEGDRVRIKDRLHEADDARQYLLEQKAFALKHGATSFQLRADVKSGNEQEQEVRHEFMIFAMNNLDSGMTYDWGVYISDWEKQQLAGH